MCAASVVAWIRPEDAAGHLSWVRTHRHAHGPYCLVLEDIQPLPEPLPMRGGQKIFSAELPRDFAMELGFLNGPVLFGRVSGCGSIDSYALGSLSAYSIKTLELPPRPASDRQGGGRALSLHRPM